MDLEHRDKRVKAEGAQPLTSGTVTTSAVEEPAIVPAADVALDASIGVPVSARPAPPDNSTGPSKAAPTRVSPPSIGDDISVWENAMMLVDKPKTWTSFDVCGKLKGSLAALLGKKNRYLKVGHAGTLDPMATGLLIVCVGRATKSIDSFVAMQKEYSGTLRLGEATPSLDAESEIVERLPWEHITDEQLLAARDTFLGAIQQLPPMFSAIRVDGQRLYEAARKGKEVERKPRAVTIHAFDLWRDEGDAQNVHFKVTCSKGTYIRSLAQDLGVAVGSTAHLVALRREAIGGHRVEAAWEIEELAAQINALKSARRGGAAEKPTAPPLAAGEAAKE